MIDLILKNCNIIDVHTSHIYTGDITIKDGIITEIQTVQKKNAAETIDLSGKYVAPGFIDFHLHIESSMLSPLEFSKEAIKLAPQP